MTQSTNRIGRIGEDLAARHLESHGFRILHRNWRASVDAVRGELDIIAMERSTLVFCEVKCRRSSTSEDTLASVTWSKQRQLRRLAALYLAGQPEHVPVRFDVVAVFWPPHGGGAEILHVRDAF
jgi:putative endonuclease